MHPGPTDLGGRRRMQATIHHTTSTKGTQLAPVVTDSFPGNMKGAKATLRKANRSCKARTQSLASGKDETWFSRIDQAPRALFTLQVRRWKGPGLTSMPSSRRLRCQPVLLGLARWPPEPPWNRTYSGACSRFSPEPSQNPLRNPAPARVPHLCWQNTQSILLLEIRVF